ncbi:MAG: hypothetical protein KDA84_10855, partial [Planctomycetaceae bacterium]|nr:hypothetical protein [Planctomycetaceae bacterium]
MSIKRIQKRFDELAAMAKEIEQSKSTSTKEVPTRMQAMGQPTRYTQTTRYQIDTNTFQQWCGSVELLLFQVF